MNQEIRTCASCGTEFEYTGFSPMCDRCTTQAYYEK